MLHHLIQNFDKEFLVPFEYDQQLIADCLRREQKKLSDVDHLEREVIDEPLLEWDYRAIDEGFLELMEPFMQSESYTPVFFSSVLRDLGCDTEQYIKACLLLEYSYYAIGVIDFFDFHKIFTLKEEDRQKYSELTQVRYAAQYLIQYPRYLVIKNVFDLDPEQNMELHKVYATVGVTTGIGRGVFLKWANSYFHGITQQHYFQNCIHVFNNFFIFPVMLAAIFAKISTAQKQHLQNAFSALTLFAKLRLEKRIYTGQENRGVDDVYSGLRLLLTFPGMALLKGGLTIDQSLFRDDKFPWVTKMHEHLYASIDNKTPYTVIADIEKAEQDLFNRFLSEAGKVERLDKTVDRLRNCYDM